MLRTGHPTYTALGLVSLFLLSACEPDLGPCDMTAATQLVYKRSRDGNGCKQASVCANTEETRVTYYVPYYAGQAVMHASCGNGGVCHSQTATGALRHGAPKGLDFDLAMEPSVVSRPRSAVPAHPRGHAKLLEWIDESWELIDSDVMPPGEIGAALQAASSWFVQTTTDLDPNERFEIAPTALPAISTAEGKETVRNWLACGAPIVNGDVELGQRGPDQIQPTWDDIYTTVISDTCVGCHAGVREASSNGNLVFADACSSWKALVGKAPSSGSLCATFPGALVTPNDPGASLLMHKLDRDPTGPMFPTTSTDPTECGFSMPFGALMSLSSSVREPIRTWIMNGAQPPLGCTP